MNVFPGVDQKSLQDIAITSHTCLDAQLEVNLTGKEYKGDQSLLSVTTEIDGRQEEDNDSKESSVPAETSSLCG